MGNRIHFLLVGIILLQIPSLNFAQVGINYNDENALHGYTLFNTSAGNYLIDNCGRVVHEWPSLNVTFYHPKLTPDGDILFLRYGQIDKISWQGDHVLQLAPMDESLYLIYEVIVLPSGNYLCVARRSITSSELQDAGFEDVYLNTDIVVELDRDNGETVWEWNIMDHVIQERDDQLPNYGIISENPQLLNMDAISDYDWNFEEMFMINGMDYNEELDQILLSLRKSSEIIIIDHSTSTVEAAGSTGGIYGKGGDILYRWGNPQNYNRGDEEDRSLYFQHSPNWIKDGPYKSKIICYNNGLERHNVDKSDWYSTVPVIDPPIDELGHYYIDSSAAFGPGEPIFEIDSIDEQPFFSGYTSGAQILPNGNIFISIGEGAQLVETDDMGQIYWHYIIPDNGYVFRAEKYPIDHPAFIGKDLIPGSNIEYPPSDYPCLLFTDIVEHEGEDKLDIEMIYYSQAKELHIHSTDWHNKELSILDMFGKVVTHKQIRTYEDRIDLSFLMPGMYIVYIMDTVNDRNTHQKILIF